MSDFFKPQLQLPFWLPFVQEIDWQLRYQSGLNALLEAERGIKAIGDEYRRIQQEFEAGLLPPELPSASHELPVEPDGGGAGVADRPDDELFKRWTWIEESNLGMRGLHAWVDAQPLMPEAGSGESNSPVAHLFAQVECRPHDALLEEQTRFLLAQAERHFMLLLIGQPDDVLALGYRARARQVTAVFLRLSMLPLGEQPTCYPPAEDYRKVVDSAIDDFGQAISLWEQGFERDEQGGIGCPIGSSTQQLMIKYSLFECYLRRYELNWAERGWEDALVDLSGAIALKPRKIALYLARAELWHRTGQFGAQAKDCLRALALVKPHLPNSQQREFDQGLAQLRLAMAIGNAQTVIKYSLKFWAANPMLVGAG